MVKRKRRKRRKRRKSHLGILHTMHSSFRQSIFEVFENFENLENFQISCSCVNFSVEYTWGISWSNETSKANACLISIINVVEERRLQFQTSVIRNNFQFLRFKQSKKGRAYLARFIFKLFKKRGVDQWAASCSGYKCGLAFCFGVTTRKEIITRSK